MITAIPKKELGQHWLRDVHILGAICDNAKIQSGDTVLEIGPGLGTLTAELLRRGAIVNALEFDTTLANNLKLNIKKMIEYEENKLHIINADIRKFDFSYMPRKYKIVANIPYYLTSNLVGQLCDIANPPLLSAMLMQKEVAQRIATENKRSLLSVIAQYSYQCSLGEPVDRQFFDPPPKVDSQVLIMERRNFPIFDADKKLLYRLFKAAFSEKRKNLRNALSGGLGYEKSEIEKLLELSSIGFDRRAESLEWPEWEKLYSNFSKSKLT